MPRALADQTRRLQRQYDRMAAQMGRDADSESSASWRRLFWQELPAGLVLELGVGAGINLPRYPRESTVIGFDFSEAMLHEACERSGRHSLVRADAQELSFASKTFDAVVASFVFCGIQEPLVALTELRRVCKSDARLLLIEHGRGGGLLGPLMDILDPLATRLSGGEHINGRQVEWVREAGFRVESVDSFAWGIVKLIRATM